MRRGLNELINRKMQRAEGNYGGGPIDELFAPVAKGLSFEGAARDYLAEVSESAKANKTSQKWVDKQKAHVALLVEIIGPDTPLREVDYDQCRGVRGVLATIPAHRQKLYPQLELERAIAQGEADERPTLSPVTQDQYLATLRAVLSLAVKKRQIPINPAADIVPLQRENVRSKDRRIPWTNRQLHDFFDGKFYHECVSHNPDAPYLSDKNGWRFWMPLLALFMGMRANEIAQLHVADITKTPAGTWYADIVASETGDEEGGGKRLKTEASRRKLPMPSGSALWKMADVSR
jgi:integrase